MVELDAFALGALIIGLLLIAMTMGSSYLSRLPLNAAMLYWASVWRSARWAWDCFGSMPWKTG